MYYAPGATHAPHHVPKEWSDKYKGKFDGGWDKQREATFARQQQPGRHPQGRRADAPTEADPRVGRHAGRDEADPGVSEMEIYAGFLEQTDHHIGRVVAALEELGSLDDTLIDPSSATTARRRRGSSTAASTR